MTSIPWLSPDNLEFPPLSSAQSEPNGLLAIGGDLSEARLLAAYQQGIFPWFEDSQPILWWSPNPRCVLYPAQLHISRSLKKELKRSTWTVRADTAFESVLNACAAPTIDREDTWITSDMGAAYTHLHEAGWAHSIEVWDGDELIGGLYGIALGKVFFGESMFSRRPNASKIALVYLCQQLQQWDYQLIDCQIHNPHLQSMGAEYLDRAEFSVLLSQHTQAQSPSSWRDSWHTSSEKV